MDSMRVMPICAKDDSSARAIDFMPSSSGACFNAASTASITGKIFAATDIARLRARDSASKAARRRVFSSSAAMRRYLSFISASWAVNFSISGLGASVLMSGAGCASATETDSTATSFSSFIPLSIFLLSGGGGSSPDVYYIFISHWLL